MPRCMYAGSANVLVRLVVRVRVQVVDDRLVDVPADEVDRRERRQRAAGVRADELIHERDAVLLGELRDLVEHLEADAVAGERRRVGGLDHLAAERRRRAARARPRRRRGSVPACGMSSQPTIIVGGLNRWMPRKLLAEARRCGPRTSPAIDRPDDTVATIESGARSLIDQREHLALDRRGPRRPPRRSRSASASACAEIRAYVPHVDRSAATPCPWSSCSARARPASAFSSVRARNTVGIPAAANTAPDPDPIAPLAPSTTILRIDLISDHSARVYRQPQTFCRICRSERRCT